MYVGDKQMSNISSMYTNSNLPEVYVRNNKECFLDEHRKKLIVITPEEIVRQKMILFIKNKLGVPEQVITLEERLSHYGIQSNGRADIIIHSQDKEGILYPLCIVECKAETVELTHKVMEQAFGYADALETNYVIITNGCKMVAYKYIESKNNYICLETIPTYDEMICDTHIEYDPGKVPDRIPFSELENIKEDFDLYDESIGKDTPLKYKSFAINLMECFMDISHKIQNINCEMFRVVKDYGIRILEYGTTGGGKFSGPYRSILIKAIMHYS